MHLNSKIENFIRTKYESKRWVMDGPMPDPSTLGDADDDDVVSDHKRWSDYGMACADRIASCCCAGEGQD